MTDIVEWLREQLAEDEQIARAVFGEYEFFYGGDGHSDGVYRFLRRWNPEDPEMVLREIEAKRRIIDMGDAFAVYSEPYTSQMTWGCVVRLLALPYADRPGYDPAWTSQ